MKNRILSTVVLWILFIILPLVLGNWGAFILIAFFAIGTQLEFVKLLHKIGPQPKINGPIAATAILLLSAMIIPPWQVNPMVTYALIFSAAIIIGLFQNETKPFFNGVIPAVLAIGLIALPFYLAIVLVHEVGMILPIWILAVAKFTDVGALLFGLKFGKTPMSPKLSPKKTWEGLAGGLVTALMVGMILYTALSGYFHNSFSLLNAGLVAIPIALGGVLADLIESAIKREAKVKDSGSFIPGIGGFFDLTDSVLLAIPIGYALFWLCI